MNRLEELIGEAEVEELKKLVLALQGVDESQIAILRSENNKVTYHSLNELREAVPLDVK